jgi:hypothetical protein
LYWHEKLISFFFLVEDYILNDGFQYVFIVYFTIGMCRRIGGYRDSMKKNSVYICSYIYKCWVEILWISCIPIMHIIPILILCMLIYVIAVKSKWGGYFRVVCKFNNLKWLWKKVLENLRRCFSQDAIVCHGY